VTEPVLEVRDLCKSYGRKGENLDVLDHLNFSVHPGELVCILGPSGAGKTTLLRCISGLEKYDSGTVILDGELVESPPEHMAFVFQDYSRSLLPWMSISANVELVLRRRQLGRDAAKRRVRSALADVGLADFESAYPWQLSGGMQQRVAIARALAYDAPLLVMDEPFAAVDAQTRADLQDLLLAVHAKLKPAILFVTHDVDEATFLGDRVAVLTQRPASVRRLVDIGLPKPRDQITTKEDPTFIRLRSEILSQIRR